MPRPVRALAPLAACTFLVAAACREPRGVGPFLPSSAHAESSVEQLRFRQRQWAALELVDYDFDFSATCFCAPSFTQPAVVHVRGGRVASVTPLGGHPAAEPQVYPTIDALLERAIAAVERGDYVDGSFDERYGYPTSLTIGTLANDAGTRYEVRRVRRAP